MLGWLTCTAVASATVIIALRKPLRRRMDLNAEEDTTMTSEAYKAWLDAMPVDDVRRRIERLEQKLSDLHVLERLYTDRPHAGEGASEHTGEEPLEHGEGALEHGSEPT